MHPSSVVLLSGGLDSTANLVMALERSRVELAITADYGQRAAPAEIRQSKLICQALGVRHQVIKIDFLKELGGSGLTESARMIPVGSEVGIDHLAQSQKTAAAVWVPNRNGLLLNIAACFADRYGWSWVVPGFNLEEAKTFPDNSEEFLQAVNQAFGLSTRSAVKAVCFTTGLVKTDIYRETLLAIQRLKADSAFSISDDFSMDLIWPCYFDGQMPCGQCESCQRFQRAQSAAKSPTLEQ